jgi:hypothetical protein
MCLRVVVREVESWLLADREGLARFLGVAQTLIPKDPESLPDPKAAMISLARRSRRREVRDDMVPRPGSGRPIGPAYPARLIEFAANVWTPETAADRSDSLKRALRCLTRLIAAEAKA